MFIHFAWSIALLALVAGYFLFERKRLAKKYPAQYAHLDGFWAKVGAFIMQAKLAFGVFVGGLLTSLPDLLVTLPYLDLSFLPHPWPLYAGLIGMVISAALKTAEMRSDKQDENEGDVRG